MQENAVVIASKEREAVLYLAEDAPRAVRIACTNFLTDLNKICGCPARMTNDAREANVLVGVIGEDAALRRVAVVLFCRRPREKAAVRVPSRRLLQDGLAVRAVPRHLPERRGGTGRVSKAAHRGRDHRACDLLPHL